MSCCTGHNTGVVLSYTGNGDDKQNIHKIVSCDVLKEKLEKLVKQSKSQQKMDSRDTQIWKDLDKDKPIESNNNIVGPPKNYVNLVELNQLNTSPSRSKSTAKSKANVQINLKDIESMRTNTTEAEQISEIQVVPKSPHNASVQSNGVRSKTKMRRSESWQNGSKYVNTRQLYPQIAEARVAEVRQLDQRVSGPSLEEDAGENVKSDEGNTKAEDWFEIKTVSPSAMSRRDPKRISRRYIPRKLRPNAGQENGQDAYEKLNLLPPTQFRDAPPPPPPEAFRDPPEPIDNILYYVVESVHENREANRRDYEEALGAKKTNHDYQRK